MGHTHVRDTYEWTLRGGHCIYLNSGTWTGDGQAVEDREHATYLGVDLTGQIQVKDWIRDPLDEPR